MGFSLHEKLPLPPFTQTENSQTFPNVRIDGSTLSSSTERNVNKYQGHGDVGVWTAGCGSADSKCNAVQ